ncbi:hypothetical protein [Deinococcus marmoris]|uniref:Uncharacterized protein n=1 Tax=Deinococcus marmoris TaxID=249408 RepID=A0A1U7NX97_9DEIO|nr:hypothetical protein [Deinococcus marmoris]OLV17527.1 hypothetical protein BOO71_0008560 [Deinococcus marmoris]
MTAHVTTWPRTSAPWIVGRPARFSDAAEDFINELTRQEPWRKVRSEAWLEALGDALGDPVLGAAFPEAGAKVWLASLPDDEQAGGRALLEDFETHLRGWGWLAR